MRKTTLGGSGYASSPQRAQLLLNNYSSTPKSPNAKTPPVSTSLNGTRFGANSSNTSSATMRRTNSKSGPVNRTSSSNGRFNTSQQNGFRPHNSSAGFTIRRNSDPDQSAVVLKQRLESLTGVRKQLEQLALRHKKEEENLAKAMSGIVLREETEHKTRGELMQLVEERNRAIRMLDKFRQEGNEVTARLHNSLKRSQQQNDEMIQQLRTVADENDRLRTEAQHGSSAQRSNSPLAEDPRVPQYQRLLADADDMLQELKVRNEHMGNRLAELEQQQGLPPLSGGGEHWRSSLNGVDVISVSSEPAVPADLEEARSVIVDLRRQLKGEKQARLEAEEFSSKVMTEHRKSVSLLEQRVARQQEGSGASPTGVTPRRSLGLNNPGNRTPTLRPTESTPNRSQRLQGLAHEVPADPSPEPTPATDKRSSTGSESKPRTPLEAVLEDGSEELSPPPPTTREAAQTEETTTTEESAPSTCASAGSPHASSEHIDQVSEEKQRVVAHRREIHLEDDNDASPEAVEVVEEVRRSGSNFDHAQAMQELEMLESQLAEVAAELGEP